MSTGESFTQTVKAQADIVRIVGEYLRLRKAGANWSALCPFHKENSGSFHLYADPPHFYCFGCHEHGDIFSFVQKMDTLTFPEAVRTVAEKMGIPVPERTFSTAAEAKEAGQRRQLIDLHEAATEYFQAQLTSPAAASAREYVTMRGITAETVAKFRIGYAPESYNDLRDVMAKRFPEDVLRSSGLFSMKEQAGNVPAPPLYSRFRKRLMFPIANEQGRTIAFTGRTVGSSDDAKAGAKYLNSPETPLYTKGNVLFNLDKAKVTIKADDAALLVEGQMDCLSVFMGGMRGVVATSGTAFTEHQVRLLKRFTKRVVVNFDPDNAGAAATEKTVGMLVEEDFEVRVVTLPDGMDPDGFIRQKGMEAYIQAVRGAARHPDYLIDRALSLFPGRVAETKVKAMNYLLPHIAKVPSAVARADFAENAAQRLGVESSLMRQELKKAAQGRIESVPARRAVAVSEVERILLCALVRPDGDPLRMLAAEHLGQNPDWSHDLAASALFETLVHGPAPENPLDVAPDAETRHLLATALHQGIEDGEISMVEQVEGALRELHDRRLGHRSMELRGMIAAARRKGDTAMVGQLTQEKITVERGLRGP